VEGSARAARLALPLVLAVAAGGLPALGGAPSAFSAGVSEGVFVTNANNTISQYAIGAGGALDQSRTSATIAGHGVPYALAISPNGRYVYVADDHYAASAGAVAQYSIGVGGLLSPDSIPTVRAGVGPIAIALSPSARFAYVANEDAGTVFEYAVGSGGMLSTTPRYTFKAGVAPDAIAVAPNGRYLYVLDQFAGTGSQTAGAVEQFTVASSGAVTADPTPSVPAGDQPDAITISPNGRQIYVANFRGTAGVSQYAVGAGGMLTPDRQPTVQAGGAPHGIAVSPNGRFVYVATEDGPGSAKDRLGGVSQYTVGASGMLTPDPTASVEAGYGSFAIAVSPDGNYVYVANDRTSGSRGVSQFTIGADGMLSADHVAAVSAGELPLAIAVAPPRR
jgi:DNA-binding beta-propeller fold protein YncE